MIFVTVGTQLPFDRLIHAVESWAIENSYDDICFQVGEGAYKPNIGRVYEYIEHQELQKILTKVDLVIGHAGMGTILTSLTLGVPLVVLPRSFSLGEHRNDHQFATYEKVKSKPGVFGVQNEKAIFEKINLALNYDKAEEKLGPNASKELTDYIRSRIF